MGGNNCLHLMSSDTLLLPLHIMCGLYTFIIPRLLHLLLCNYLFRKPKIIILIILCSVVVVLFIHSHLNINNSKKQTP